MIIFKNKKNNILIFLDSMLVTMLSLHQKGEINMLALKYQSQTIPLFLDQFKSEETLRGYKFIIKDFFSVENELQVTNQMIQQVTYHKVQEYIKHLINQNKKKSTVNRSVNCLRSLFNYAYAEEIVTCNPFADTRIKNLIRVNMTKDEDEIVGRALSKEEINKLLTEGVI